VAPSLFPVRPEQPGRHRRPEGGAGEGRQYGRGQPGAAKRLPHNDKVKIRLPSALEQAMPIIRMTGQGAQVDALVTDMNHAAEAAVPLAKPLLVNAVKSMSVSDAKNILSGGDTGDRLLPPEDLG
jgi:hypothetical protein